MTEQTTTNLEVLENRAEKALEKAETGWREFAEAMRDIKESEAHKEAGYRYFSPYYSNVWAERTGRTAGTLKAHIQALVSLEEMSTVGDGDLDPLPGPTAARILRHEIADPQARVEAWREHLGSGRKMGHNREGLRESIAEYKGEGVIEAMEAEGEIVPDYPSGPTAEEQSASAVAELARLARDVTPEAAADSMTPGLAQTTARRQEFLVGWLRRYVAHLELRGRG